MRPTKYLEEAEHLLNQILVLDTGRMVAAGTASDTLVMAERSTLRLERAQSVALPWCAGLCADLIPPATQSYRRTN